jgi:uncharacterized membrane protein
LGMNSMPALSKTLSFAAVHFTVAFSLAYLITGSLVTGGLIALIEPCCNTVAYHLHEKAWAKTRTPSPAACCLPFRPAHPAG